MNRVLRVNEHHCLKRAGISLLAVALIAGMMGCPDADPDPPVQYTLTISSTAGGSVTAPGEPESTYDCGATVALAAQAEERHRFVNWTGDVDTIADVDAAETTITMNDNYFVHASFVMEIRDWNDLDAIRDNLHSHCLLMNELDATTSGYAELSGPTANDGKGWQPIGYEYYDDGWVRERFEGVFDGGGYEIRDLFINRPDEGRVGLLGAVDKTGVIKDVGVVNASVTGAHYVGGLVGHNDGNIYDCHFTGSVNGWYNVGGLVGYIYLRGRLSRSYSTGHVTGEFYAVGGLVGTNHGTVSASYSSASVTGDRVVGGLVGENVDRGAVTNCYSTGKVAGNSQVGGLMGKADGGTTVINSYSTGRVTGYSAVGGLMGWSWYNVWNCFWDRESSGMEESDGGTGKITVEMKDMSTYRTAGWLIVGVAADEIDVSSVWNIVDGETYPFLSWQSVLQGRQGMEA